MRILAPKRVSILLIVAACGSAAAIALAQGPPHAYVAVPLGNTQVVVEPAGRSGIEMEWHTIDGSGGPLTGDGDILLEGTVGQPDAGLLSEGSIELVGGLFGGYVEGESAPACYANCDGSTSEPILTVDDFLCFINQFSIALTLPFEEQVTHYANCDGRTSMPVLTIDDFMCFINAFSMGCP